MKIAGYAMDFATDQLDHAYDDWSKFAENYTGLCMTWIWSSDGYRMRCGRPAEMHPEVSK